MKDGDAHCKVHGNQSQRTTSDDAPVEPAVESAGAQKCPKCGATMQNGYCAFCDPDCQCPAYCPKHMNQPIPESAPAECRCTCREALLRLRDGIDTDRVHCEPLMPTSAWRYVVDVGLAAPCECERLREENERLGNAFLECFRAGMPQAQLPLVRADALKYAALTLAERLRGLNRLTAAHADERDRLRSELEQAQQESNQLKRRLFSFEVNFQSAKQRIAELEGK